MAITGITNTFPDRIRHAYWEISHKQRACLVMQFNFLSKLHVFGSKLYQQQQSTAVGNEKVQMLCALLTCFLRAY